MTWTLPLRKLGSVISLLAEREIKGPTSFFSFHVEATDCLCHRWSRIFSLHPSQSPLCSFMNYPQVWIITRWLIWVTRRMPLVEQELIIRLYVINCPILSFLKQTISYIKSGLQRPAEGVLRIWKSKEYSGKMRTGQKDKHWCCRTVTHCGFGV
jgi:hypothetical protein